MNSADYCRSQGWTVGDVIEDEIDEVQCRIMYIGQRWVVVVGIGKGHHDGIETVYIESIDPDWRLVEKGSGVNQLEDEVAKLRRVADAARIALPTMARVESDGWISTPLDPDSAALAEELRKAVRELDEESK